jgi:hypothetical protein
MFSRKVCTEGTKRALNLEQFTPRNTQRAPSWAHIIYFDQSSKQRVIKPHGKQSTQRSGGKPLLNKPDRAE